MELVLEEHALATRPVTLASVLGKKHSKSHEKNFKMAKLGPLQYWFSISEVSLTQEFRGADFPDAVRDL